MKRMYISPENTDSKFSLEHYLCPGTDHFFFITTPKEHTDGNKRDQENRAHQMADDISILQTEMSNTHGGVGRKKNVQCLF